MASMRNSAGGRPRRMSSSVRCLLTACLLVSGCARGWQNVTTVPTLDVAAVRQVAVSWAAVEKASPVDAKDLARAIVEKLQASGRVGRVYLESSPGIEVEPGHLLLRCEVTDDRHVSSGLRGLAGVFVGRAWIRAHVTMLDGATRGTLGAVDVEGYSSVWGNTDQAIDEAAETVVEFVISGR